MIPDIALRIVPFMTLMLLCSATAGSADAPRVDPGTGLIRVLFMGDAYMEPGFVTPIMVQDPMIALNPIPVEFITLQYTSINAAARLLRAYFPRVRRQLVEGYDVLIMAEVREPFVPPECQRWIKEGVIDEGMGFLMGGGAQSFGGYLAWNHPSWDGSPVGDIIAVTCLEGWHLGTCHMVPVQQHENHPLVRNIPWKQLLIHKRNRVTERQGTVVLARTDRNPPGSPVLSYMEMGRGISEAFTWNWGGDGTQDFHRWSFTPIFLSNLVYYAARVKIPEDMGLFMRLRTLISSYDSLRRYAISVIDFADRFNANLREAEKALYDAEQGKKAVNSLYVQGEFDNSLERLEGSLEDLDRAAQMAIKAKNEALLWVYVIEWFTVSGTAMFSGGVLWTLMVRRPLYREAGLTRFDR
jgi:uncharacterized membrane protein